MARIPKHELDALKRHVSLLTLAQSQGHKLKKHGADSYVCLCPFHDEKTPSRKVRRENRYRPISRVSQKLSNQPQPKAVLTARAHYVTSAMR